MGFPLVPKSVTLNDLELRNTESGTFRANYAKVLAA